jgi:cellulose synthase/poly-beta-1,6-N-acetylglucosamine synthase-like glycosyltransferase
VFNKLNKKLSIDLPSIVRLISVDPVRNAVDIFPEKLSIKYSLVPLYLEEKTLILAGPLTIDSNDMEKIRILINHPVRFFLCPLNDFVDFRNRCYPHQEMKPDADTFSKLFFDENRSENMQPQIEILSLIHNIPHLHNKCMFSASGLDLLLPQSLNREHFVPMCWIDGMMYCLIDDPSNIRIFQEKSRGLDFQCQLVLTSHEVLSSVYRRSSLIGPAIINCSNSVIIDSLIQKKLLTREQGQYALETERQTGVSCRELFIENRIIKPDIWLKTRADLLKCEALLSEEIPPDFVRNLQRCKDIIPAWIVRKFQILPIFENAGTLIIGINEINFNYINLAAAVSHCQIELRLMDSEIILKWIDKIYPTRFYRDLFPVIHLESLITELGYLTLDQIQKSIRVGIQQHKSWLKIATEKGYIRNSELLEVLSLFSGYPFYSMDHFPIDESLIAQYSWEDLNRNKVFPLFRDEIRIWTAISDPLNLDGLSNFQKISQRQIVPIIVQKSIFTQILHIYSKPENRSGAEELENQFIEHLVNKRLITRQNAITVIGARKKSFIPLAEAIELNSSINPEELAKSIAGFYQYPYEDISLRKETQFGIDAIGNPIERELFSDPIDGSAACLLSYEDAQLMRALPIRFQNDKTVVAFSDIPDPGKIDYIEQFIDKPIIPIITVRKMLEDGIQRQLGKPPLGSILLLAGMITRSQLNDALDYAQKNGIRIGKALIYKQFIQEDVLFQFLAKQSGLSYFDLEKTDIEKNVVQMLDAKFERVNGLLPVSADQQKIILATVDPLNYGAIEEAKSRLKRNVRLVLISESKFEEALESVYQQDYIDESISSLLERAPGDSAFHILDKQQQIFLLFCILLSIFGIFVNARFYFVLLNAVITIFYLLFSLYKFEIIFKAVSSNLEIPVTDQEIIELTDAELPIFSILIPVFHESEVLSGVLNSLMKIDYPPARLDILVLLEADDFETIAEFDRINPPRFIHKIIVPASEPRTKPKACNYGLIHAKGEYIVIYDAEDVPDRDQLKRVVIAFSKAPENVACIQAKLNFYNRRQNLLTRWFTVEYSMWFDLLLPGLDAEHAPIPLGGTSNHFRKSSLLEVGAWDPHNVTEDADLGIRLFKRGYRTRIVDSTTYEEANSKSENWLRQRSRWLKGYMVTWIVHMRHPIRLIQEIGIKNFMSFQFIVGGTFFSALLNPIYWTFTILWLVLQPSFIQKLFPPFVFYMGVICLYVATFVFTYVNVAGAMRRGYYDMVWAAILSPIYWAMSSIASWKGFIQLIFKPHFWEKTHHGLYQNNHGENELKDRNQHESK